MAKFDDGDDNDLLNAKTLVEWIVDMELHEPVKWIQMNKSKVSIDKKLFDLGWSIDLVFYTD